jgi:hypothetical protein
MSHHHEELFSNADEARRLCRNHGFTSLVRVGDAEHFVREAQRCILYWKGDDPKAVPLDSAEHVWFFLTVSSMKDEAIIGASFG